MNTSFDSVPKSDSRLYFYFLGSSCSGSSRMIRQQGLSSPEVTHILGQSFHAVIADCCEKPQLAAMLRAICTAATGTAALPLFAAALPDGRPFYISSGRLPQGGLAALLQSVLLLWKNNPSSLQKAAEDLCASVVSVPSAGSLLSEETIRAACKQLSDSYDSEYPGFGTSIRFPSVHMLSFLMSRSAQCGEKKLRSMADSVLKQMYYGGIYDHFSGGFFRCADREWFLPLFEKPLAENACLAMCYVDAWQNGRLPLYRTVAEATLDFLLRELKASNGLYYAGCYCGRAGEASVLTRKEVLSVLGEEHGRHFCECYDITEEGNTGAGTNIPNLLLNNRRDLLPEGYDDFREQLRLYRESRSLPKPDRHISSLANGMLLSALSRAAAVFGDRRYLLEAEALAAQIRTQLLSGPRVLAVPGGEEADLSSYAAVALGFLDLYSADYDPDHILQASLLANELILHFSAPDGSFFSCTNAMPLQVMELFDSALPSAIGLTAQLLSRLLSLTGEARWKVLCLRLLNAVSPHLGSYPAGCTSALSAAVELLYPVGTILCTTPESHVPELLHAVASATGRISPVLLKTPGTAAPLTELLPNTADCAIGDRPSFYLFRDGSFIGPYSLS